MMSASNMLREKNLKTIRTFKWDEGSNVFEEVFQNKSLYKLAFVASGIHPLFFPFTWKSSNSSISSFSDVQIK